jgi:hypothetical protein
MRPVATDRDEPDCRGDGSYWIVAGASRIRYTGLQCGVDRRDRPAGDMSTAPIDDLGHRIANKSLQRRPVSARLLVAAELPRSR